jgi:dihydrofolate synthase / folylpolyglutamate synthase
MYSDELSRVLSRLDALTNWEQRPRGTMRVGLEPMIDLMHRLGDPHLAFRAVHVTGTKGKGSVCAMIEAALHSAGVRVGRYSSPHLQTINERVNIQCAPVSDRQLSGTLALALDAFEQAERSGTDAAESTWFDILTAAAFLTFREAGLDWVVVEVGLGGRLDSTNVVDGDVAVVTNVGLEHTEILGTTRVEIAREKGGILKHGALLVTSVPAEDEAGQVLQLRAKELGCPSMHVPLQAGASIEEVNATLAGVVLDHLGCRGVDTDAAHGQTRPVGAWLLDEATRASARLPGRLECLKVGGSRSSTLSVVLDGAHVPFNLEAVLQDLTRRPGLAGRCVALVAIGADKDAPGLLSVLSRYVSHLVLTDLPGPPRGFAATDLQSVATALGISSEIHSDFRTAASHAMKIANHRSEWLLVTGSLHLVGAVRRMKEFAEGARL